MVHKPSLWHIFGVTSAPIREFARALGKIEPTSIWVPHMYYMNLQRPLATQEPLPDSPFIEIHFPLQRGYSRPLIGRLSYFAGRTGRLLQSRSTEPATSVLVCTSPFHAPLGDRWPGPVVYYATDLVIAYDGVYPNQVKQLDRRLCRRANLVCPNSKRIAAYLEQEGGCAPERIHVIPNATRAEHIRSFFSHDADELPEEIGDMPRPIAGVIGNMAANTDWQLVSESIELVPQYSWLFVGPTSTRIAERAQSEARDRVMRHPRCRFIGARPYGSLQAYARAMDVAVLPYSRREPTYSGSATRFYEHLAACRPMLATPNVAELIDKEPLVTLVDGRRELVMELRRLLDEPIDGQERARWIASMQETWEQRARSMVEALDARMRSSTVLSGSHDQLR